MRRTLSNIAQTIRDSHPPHGALTSSRATSPSGEPRSQTQSDLDPAVLRQRLDQISQGRTREKKRNLSKFTGSKERFIRAATRVSTNFQLYDPAIRAGAPYGFFNGRPIIGENTPINGGIYLGVYPQEAIVVDEKHGSLIKIYHELRTLISNLKIQDKLNEREILISVCSLVEGHLKFDYDQFDALAATENFQPDNKTSLDLFIESKVGVARHQVLLAAYLIEKLIKQGVLSGCLSLDGATNDPAAQDDRLLYTSQTGVLFVLDPLKSATSRVALGVPI